MQTDRRIQQKLTKAFGDISNALDQVPADRERVFLAKLVLVLCRDMSLEDIRAGISIALRDLDYQPEMEA